MLAKSKSLPNKTEGAVSTASSLMHRHRVLIGAVSVIAVLLVGSAGYALYFGNRVLPQLSVAGVAVSGKTLPQLIDAVQSQAESLSSGAVVLKVGDASLDIHPSDIGLVIDAKATADAVYGYGRRVDFWSSVLDMATQVVHAHSVPFVVTIDQEKLKKVVGQFAVLVDQPEVNAGVKVESGKVVETGGVAGHRLNQTKTAEAVVNHWQNGQIGTVVLVTDIVQPKITKGSTKEVITQAEVLRGVKVTLHAPNKDYHPSTTTTDTWIASEVNGEHIQAGYSSEAVKAWLQKVAPDVNQDPIEAKVTVTDGHIAISSKSVNGQVLDTDQTAAAILSEVRRMVVEGLKQKTLTIAPVLIVQKPVITETSIASLGINELVGTATTSFVGSPENRKHNISIGASALNGILVKTGDEFSTLKYLGKIDNTTGYLPELVIKEDKTTPEFGGGLCQVSTTLFRAALNTGLKITERRNHRYRVGYYEPPVGMDATIYEGSPDLKFVNDTPNYILIQSHIEGTKITFDFYGTKDGRRSETTAPVVSDIVNPPDPDYVQTDTLLEGTTKQTEKAHAGANAAFTYSVFNADGSVHNKQTFTSHYVPWRARFLVGTKKADTPPVDQSQP